MRSTDLFIIAVLWIIFAAIQLYAEGGTPGFWSSLVISNIWAIGGLLYED